MFYSTGTNLQLVQEADYIATFHYVLPIDNILSVNEKLPLLKFRYFETYKRNLDSYFTFRVSGQLQTRLEQYNRSLFPATGEQLLHVHFVIFAVYQNVKTFFSKTNMPVYA